MPDTDQSSPQLFLFGSSHHTAPLEVRERFAIPNESIADLYRELKTSADVTECMVLNTCNRVEIYGVTANGYSEQKIFNLLETRHGIPAKQLQKFSFSLRDEDVVKHAFEVAAGIDSQMLGETEILGQVKASYATASELSATGPILNRLFQKSFQAAKWARTNTGLGQGQISIGNIAVDLAERVCGDLSEVNLLLIGTGEAGQKTAQALVSRGVEQLTVVSRNHDRANTIADEFGAASGAIRDLDKFLPHMDVVIGSTVAEEPLIDRKRLKPILKQRPSRPYFFIDLGVPRNIESRIAKFSNVYLYNLDDLSGIANENLKSRMNEVDQAKAGLAERAKRLWEHFS